MVFGPGRRRLLDYLIRPRQQRWWDRQTERLGGLEVDGEIELRGVFDGKISGLGTLNELIDVASGTAVDVKDLNSAYALGATWSLTLVRADALKRAAQQDVRKRS
jgi:hypothetical protein